MQPELYLAAVRPDLHGVGLEHDAFAAHVRRSDQRLGGPAAASGHQPQQIFFVDVGLFQHADVAAVAQHRRPVADASHLGDAVRDDDHGGTVVAQLAHLREQTLGGIQI